MRLREFRYDIAWALRGGIVLLGLVAVAVPSALSRDGKDGSNGNGAEASAEAAAAAADASHRAAAMRGEATGGLGLTSEPSPAAAAGTKSRGGPAGTRPSAWIGGQDAFAMSALDITESFDSLTKQQQARIMRRCKDVIAKPGEADPNQLALCQTLTAMTRR